jgi:peptidyl-prolyl cis-trans isomerase SurA
MKRKGMKTTTLLFGMIFVSVLAAAQTLDRIVAVVENDLILESELNSQVQFFIFNNKVDPKTPGLKDQVLQSMINEKLIVAKAIEDSVAVTDEEVQQQLDAVIQQRIQQAGSEARLEEMWGMPLSRIKREFREEMRKSLLAQRLQQQRFGAAQVGRYEVEEFYRTYKDSLPRVPEEVELAHILVKPQAGEASKDAARAKMQSILDSIKAGADFGALARRYSQDPGSAQQGGELGLVRRGQFVKEFEIAAFSLSDGQLSGIVETEIGLHIIQLIERRGDAVRARHILLRIEKDKASDDVAIRLLDSLRTRILAGENFADLAHRYSEDKETNLVGGNLGTLDLEQLDKTWRATVAPMKEGEISAPTRLAFGNTYGFHIVWVKKRTAAHAMTLDKDYRKVEAIALNYKRNRDYQSWIEELRSKIFWQTRLQAEN